MSSSSGLISSVALPFGAGAAAAGGVVRLRAGDGTAWISVASKSRSIESGVRRGCGAVSGVVAAAGTGAFGFLDDHPSR